MKDQHHDAESHSDYDPAHAPTPPHRAAPSPAGEPPQARLVDSRAPAKSSSARSRTGPPASSFNARFVLGVVRHWWKVTMPVGLLLAVGAAAWMWWSFEPVYEAQAWLQIEDRRPYIAFPTRDDSRRFVDTQVQLIRSPLVVGPAVSEMDVNRIPGLARTADKTRWLGERISVRPVGNSELFIVSFASTDQNAAATVVNEVVGKYQEFGHDDEAKQMEMIIDLLTKELEKRKTDVSSLQNEVRVLSKNSTGIDPYAVGPETQLVHDPLSELQMQMANASVELAIAKVQKKAFEQSRAANEIEVPEADVNRAVEEHPEMDKIRASIQSKIATLAEYEARLVGEKQNPRYIQLAEQLQDDEERLEQTRQRMRLEIGVQMRTMSVERRKSQIAELGQRIKDYEVLESVLEEQLQGDLTRRSTLTGHTVELEFKKSDLARAEAVQEQIAQRVVALRTEKAAPERVKVRQWAVPPTVPVEGLSLKKIGMLCLALFSFPFGLAIGWELLVRRVSDAERLEQDTHLSVVGEIARLPTRTVRLASSGARSRRAERIMDIFEESVDSLRTGLLLSESLQDMKVILVTSAASSEGKTSVAVQLAVSLSRASGRRTLLVDGDMRAPDIHRLLGLSLEPGLSDVLAGDCSVQDAVQTDFSDLVHVLTSGRVKMSPHRLVGNGTLKPMFDEFRARYDYVVVDSPPVLAVSETLVLARQADASLVCAMRQDTSRVDQVRRTHERLAAAAGRPVGVVLNGVPTDHYARRYGTYAYTRDWE